MDRAAVYIRNLEGALNTLVLRDRACKHVVDLARAYLKDSKYYYSVGDIETAIATASYAEGLLDALRLIGAASFEWRRPSEVKNARSVMVAGTFEILHPGHLAYLREAWRLGYVTAVVSSDENAARFKGRKIAIPQSQRAEVLSSVYYVHRVVMGGPGNIFDVLELVRPDVILLGPDQRVSEDEVRREARGRGLEVEVIRMREIKSCGLCSTTKVIEKILAEFSGCR
jgi:FAD synthetase